MPRTTIKELREQIEALKKQKEELRKKADRANAVLIGKMMRLLACEVDDENGEAERFQQMRLTKPDDS